MPRLSLPALAALALLSAAATAEQPAAPPLPAPAELAGLLARADVPGLSMATLTACRPGEHAAAGLAIVETGQPVTEDTAFEAASLSKPVFAWLVMTLVQDGTIDLDRPLARDFAYPRITDAGAYAQLTPRLILQHRTGLPNWVATDVPFREREAPIPFDAPPDTAFSYSGEAFQLLQAYVEDRTGRTLQTLFAERLGRVMPNSTFTRPLPAGVAPSRGYRSRHPASGRDMTNLRGYAMAASSLVTTAGDYARFLAHICRGDGLDPALQSAMLAPISPAPDDMAPFPAAWGLGWMLLDLGTGTLVGHGGNNEEYRAFAGYLRQTGDGIVILTNGANGQEVIDALLMPPE